MKEKIMFILKKLFYALVIFFAVIGLYQACMSRQYNSIKSFVEEKESARTYDKDLLYLMPRGEPVFLVNPQNTKTLFFFEGFRGQAGAGIYREWFEELHKKHGINIVSPIIGLQGWPYRYRNREWHHEEDMRQALQIYDAYTSNLPKNHTIVIGSVSFGTLANITIAAKGRRAPDACVLISPLNTELEYRSGGAVIRWLAGQTSWLRYLLPYTKRGKNPARAAEWDIVNDEKNLKVWNAFGKNIMNWEENLGHSVQVKDIARYMQERLIPQVKNRRIVVLFGDDDLYFSRKGFIRLSEKLRAAGNTVDTVEMKNTGHMLMFDNGGDAARGILTDLLGKKYKFKNAAEK